MLLFVEIRSHIKCVFAHLVIVSLLKCDPAKLLGKYLSIRQKCERVLPSPPRTWTKETLSTNMTAFLGRNHGWISINKIDPYINI
jgi:hypothetical protein